MVLTFEVAAKRYRAIRCPRCGKGRKERRGVRVYPEKGIMKCRKCKESWPAPEIDIALLETRLGLQEIQEEWAVPVSSVPVAQKGILRWVLEALKKLWPG